MLSEKAKAFSVDSLLKRSSDNTEASTSPKRTKIGQIGSNQNVVDLPKDETDSKIGKITIKKNISIPSSVILCPPDQQQNPKSNEEKLNSMYFPQSFQEPSSSTSDIINVNNKRLLSDSNVTCELTNSQLWKEFHRHQTEMIITKTGRRMFPIIKINIRGLDPEVLYDVSMRIQSEDDRRYRYSYASSRWIVSGSGEPSQKAQVYSHLDSPALGREWMNSPVISFDKLKLTNCKTFDAQGQIFLHSMQKYIPEIIIHRVNIDGISDQKQLRKSFKFDETSFVTVTAYQNQQITKLKINSNPFAKGFREQSKSKCGVSSLDIQNQYGIYSYCDKYHNSKVNALQRLWYPGKKYYASNALLEAKTSNITHVRCPTSVCYYSADDYRNDNESTILFPTHDYYPKLFSPILNSTLNQSFFRFPNQLLNNMNDYDHFSTNISTTSTSQGVQIPSELPLNE